MSEHPERPLSRGKSPSGGSAPPSEPVAPSASSGSLPASGLSSATTSVPTPAPTPPAAPAPLHINTTQAQGSLAAAAASITPHRRGTPSTSSFAPSSTHISTPRADRLATPLNHTPQSRPRSVSLMALVQDPPTLPDLSGNVPNLDLGRVRNWKDIQIGTIVNPDEARFVDRDTTVEEATKILTNCGSPNVVLVTDDIHSRVATGTFDYSDLNAYLLREVETVKAGRSNPQTRPPDRIRDLPELDRREPLVTLPADAVIPKAMEFLSSGVHRIVVTEGGENASQKVVGVLTQLRLVRFFYDNRKNFPDLADLYTRSLVDLNIGNHQVISIHGHRPLIDGLSILHYEGITSIPVLDKDNNVIGNLSHVDTRLLTRESSLPQFHAPCTSFITVIVSERGIEDGKDAYPVFHVNPFCTLAFTVAKLLATRSHRLWVVNSPSPSPSMGSTPILSAAVPQTPLFQQRPSHSFSSGSMAISPISITSHARRPSESAQTGASSSGPTSAVTSSGPGLPGAGSSNMGVPANANVSPVPPSPQFPPQYPTSHSLTGRLDGVVSLTDVLNLFARVSNVSMARPDGARRLWHRRRSSSSSAGSTRYSAVGLTGLAGSVSGGSSSSGGGGAAAAAAGVPGTFSFAHGLDGGVTRVAGRDRSVSSQSRTSTMSGFGSSAAPGTQPPPPPHVRR